MNPIQLSTDQKDGFVVVNIEIEGGTCSPSDLASLTPPELSGKHGVILNGRAPVWVFGFLIHHCHATQWVATFDPRQSGGVVIESHTQGVAVGDIIPLEGK